MAKKKVTTKKKVGGKKKSGAGVKKSAALKKVVKKAAPKISPKKKIAAKKVVARRVVTASAAKKSAGAAASGKKSTARKVRGITEEIHSPMRSSLGGGGGDFGVEPRKPRRGMGSAAAGQSGDTEGISSEEEADSESVEELLEEGQSFEAEVVSGVEKAGNADDGGVRTHEVPEDDVPEEYENQD